MSLSKQAKIEYYDINKTLSKQRLFNFVLGARGCGKSFAFKRRVINNFLSNGEQFVYLRRYETELKQSEMRNFFDDMQPFYPDVEFKTYNGLCRINGKVAGWYIPLSTASQFKSIPFPNVTLIGFDEFIIETGMIRYLPNEVRAFLEAYSTISRDRDVPVLFLSNSISSVNPYFIYFDIHMEKGQKTKLTEFISVEYLSLESFTEHMKSTKFGRLVAGTSYGEYAHENKFLLDTNDFISKLPPNANYCCTFKLESLEVGFYTDNLTGLCYISSKVDRTCPRVYALSMNIHTELTQLALRNNVFVVSLIQNYSSGTLRFSSILVKNQFIPFLKKLI